MPICGFCGNEVESVTDDHIPPKNIFGKGAQYPKIEVPGCEDCNQGTSEDDTFFRLLCLDEDARKHPTAKIAYEVLLRSFARPEQAAFNRMVFSDLSSNFVTRESGLIVPSPQVNLNRGRFLRTATKVIRGLSYHLNNRPLPKNYNAYCVFLDAFLAEWPDDVFRRSIEGIILPELVKVEAQIIGPEVFCYRVCFNEADTNIYFVLWELYNRFQFFGWTWRKDEPT